MQSKIAIVFGYSEQGEFLAKRLLISLYEHAIKHSADLFDISVFAYRCNFIITKNEDFKQAMCHADRANKSTGSYIFAPFSKETAWDLPINLPIHELDCSDDKFLTFFLPDVAVYHDFATKYAHDFDFILYCHNDLIFLANNQPLFKTLTEIVSWDSEYSIIAELRSTANYDISLRFHMCFIFANSQKFQEASLSFVNNHKLMNGDQFHVYGNGGSGLLASLYAKAPNKPRWRPYIIDVHGVYRGREITTPDKWFHHRGEVEWNRSRPVSEGSSIQRTLDEYKKAEDYVNNYKRRYAILD